MRHFRYETLPSHAMYTDVYAAFERKAERYIGMRDDALSRLIDVRHESVRTARQRLAGYTVNLDASSPDASQIAQHRAFVAGFSQSVDIGHSIFKSDEYRELMMFESMEQLIAISHDVCRSDHPEYVSPKHDPAHYTHSFIHLAEHGREVVGPEVNDRIIQWSEAIYGENTRLRSGYILGHLTTALTVQCHQNGINRLVQPARQHRLE